MVVVQKQRSPKLMKRLVYQFGALPLSSSENCPIANRSESAGEPTSMKFLELTEQDSPQLSLGVLGLAMVNETCLALGIVSGDGGYLQPGDGGAIGGTAAGNSLGIAGSDGSFFMPIADQCYQSHYWDGWPPRGNLFKPTLITDAPASVFYVNVCDFYLGFR
jgi:hypothetical protein